MALENPLVLDENEIRKLPETERFSHCERIIKFEKDESAHWDAVWLAGEIAESAALNDSLRKVLK